MSDDSKPTITVWTNLLSPPEVWEDFLAGKINLRIGDSDAKKEGDDEKRQEGRDAARDDERSQVESVPDVPGQAAGQAQEEIVEGQAVGRDVLAYKIRVQLNNPAQNWLDLTCTAPWVDWLNALQVYRGIAHDKGFIPIESIAFIVHIDTEGKPGMEMGENVVTFRKT